MILIIQWNQGVALIMWKCIKVFQIKLNLEVLFMTKERKSYLMDKIANTFLGCALVLSVGAVVNENDVKVVHAQGTNSLTTLEISNNLKKYLTTPQMQINLLTYGEIASLELAKEEDDTHEFVIGKTGKEVREEQMNKIHDAYKHLYNDYNLGLLSRIIACEYGYQTDDLETLEHKIAIGRVVLNRALEENSYFPNSVEGVIFQKNQFQPTFDGSWERKVPTDYDKKAALMAFEGYDLPQDIENALYFMYPEISDKDNVRWFRNNLTYVGKMQVHEFYK